MRRINRRLVILSIVIACDLVSVFGRPQPHTTPPNYLKDDGQNNRKEVSSTPSFIVADTSTLSSDGRSHTTKAPVMGDSFKSVTDQLLQTSVSSDVVEVKTSQKTESPPKGEAVPVLTDEDVHAVGPYTYKISSDGSTKPTGDLSTWILLGAESSPAPINMATIKKVPKPADTTVSSFIQPHETSTRKRKPTTEKMSTTHIPVTESSIKLQDSKFKNKTPVIVGKIPSTTAIKEKIEEPTTPLPELPPLDNNTRFGTPVVTFPHVPPRQRPSANNTKKTTPPEKPLNTKITSTAVVISKPANTTIVASNTTSVVATTNSSTTAIQLQNTTETTTISSNSTVKNTSLKKKKKKKNKNKRRPIKTSNNEDAQSKIDEQQTKITPGRPLSTRIYNYLAREVMPNVGVGIVGLMLTAGLAGLLLYSPLGGAAVPLVPLRRTDPHSHGHSHGHSPAGYVPPETDNSQPEEQVFGQVLSGMSYGHNPYGRERPEVAPAQAPNPKYKPSYQPSEYPAHDVPKYTVHDNSKYPSSHDASKFTAIETNKFTAPDTTKYSAPDNTQYSAPDTSKYSTIDVSVPQEKVSYPSLESSQGPPFEETQENQEQPFKNHHYEQIKFDASNAYDQPKYPAEVQGTTYHENQPSFESPKYPGYVQDVPKEEAVRIDYNFDNHRADEKVSSTTSSAEPTFSALQGVPKFYEPNVDSEQISVNVRQTMTMEHGPRSLRIRRQVDELNEIDAQLPEETTTKPSEQTNSNKIESLSNGDDNTTMSSTSTTIITSSSTESTSVNNNNNPYSLVELLKRIAEVKLKMGIEILKNTAASFTHYVNALQMRMTHVVRNLQKSNNRVQPELKQEQKKEETSTKTTEKRQRRSIRDRISSN
ncbi:mucin-5AC-like [Adelges cooleyi]|uniref:mucin-5AC-like n=1 Tax=Adelges cooleyi TaxID=133065 RepID=UPI00217FF20C|nr:mucin-5AC-like [Adelges cooleyi]